MTKLLLGIILTVGLINYSEYDPNNSSNYKLATDSIPTRFGWGKEANATRIAQWDIDVRPDGKGLPTGRGTVTEGRAIYALKCMACHGATGKEGPFDKLVHDPINAPKAKTVGNYWPYSTTLFDYIQRAMPFNQPGSLSVNEVYSLTAYLLYENKIIVSDTLLDQTNLASIQMPARSLFAPDDRTDGPIVR